MPAATYAELLTGARLMADERPPGTGPFTDSFLTDAEGYKLVSRALEHLNSEIVLSGGQELDASETTFSTVAGTAAYNLPTDHEETIMVTLEWSANNHEDVHPYEWAARALVPNATWGEGSPKGYRLLGSTISFFPVPTEAVSVKHTYTRGLTDGTSSTSVNLRLDGWRDYVELDVAARIRVMHQLDNRDLMQMRNEALERVQRLALDRIAREPMVMLDVAPEANTGRVWWPRSVG